MDALCASWKYAEAVVSELCTGVPESYTLPTRVFTNWASTAPRAEHKLLDHVAGCSAKSNYRNLANLGHCAPGAAKPLGQGASSRNENAYATGAAGAAPMPLACAAR